MTELTGRTKRFVGNTSFGRRVARPIWHRLNRPGVVEAEPGPLPAPPTAPAVVPEVQVYRGYSAEDRAVFDAFPPAGGEAQPGFLVDFLGVRTRVSYGPFGHVNGKVLGHPVPHSDWFHAETIEYVGLLKSVLSAEGRFVALELGAGWGPWLVGGAAAARRRGIATLRLYGVEADPTHFAYLQSHFRDNGLDPEAHVLRQAAVGVKAGRVSWPKVADPSADWGMRPLGALGEGEDLPEGTTGPDYQGRVFDSAIEVEVVALDGILECEDVWDLVHIDVQGSEAELCGAAAELLDRRVRWVVIGTHSRKIEGDLFDLFYRHGWVLENEKPVRFTYSASAASLEAMTYKDGTQVWRNPRF